MPVHMYHCFGCVMASLLCVVTGAALIMASPQFDARATLAAVAEERGTMLYGVPNMFIAQLDHPDFAPFDLTSLRTVSLCELFGVELCTLFGVLFESGSTGGPHGRGPKARP